MLARMKLGTKISLGFLSLIAITVALGTLAVWSMLGVKKTSRHLAEVQVPAMDITTNIERAALHTMFEARGYAYTEEKPRGFGRSDEVLHQIAKPSHKFHQAASKPAGESVIPLNGTQEDLKEFNR